MLGFEIKIQTPSLRWFQRILRLKGDFFSQHESDPVLIKSIERSRTVAAVVFRVKGDGERAKENLFLEFFSVVMMNDTWNMVW